MELSELILHGAVAAAAFAQAVTGIGFGMIAGPVVLVVMDDPAAIVVSTLMSWLIALALLPALWRGADRVMIVRLTAGAALGLPAGLALWWAADVATLKLLAGLTIGAMTCLMLFGAPGVGRPGVFGDLAFGALGGAFGGALAMPGPTAAIRMSGLGHRKAEVRATMVGFFVAIWPLVFLGQVATGGVSAATLWNAAALVPATLGGVIVGNLAAGRVSERLFTRLVLGFLIVTSAGLLVTSGLSLIGDAP